jgi:hypothetical protein
MKKLFVLALVLVGCGPESQAPAFPIELYVTAGLLNDIQSFQLSLVTRGSTLDCVQVQKSCIKDQVDATRFVKLKDTAGKDAQAAVFPISLMTGSPNTQDVSLHDLPLGKDFALIVEAVSKEPTPRLVGSSCNYVKELTAGTNAAVAARIETLSPFAGCNPLH